MSDIPNILAELFGTPKPPDLDEEPKADRLGSTADESSALGAQCLNEGDYEKAIEHFRRAIEQRGIADPQGHIDLGGAFEVADQVPQAFRQYCKAVKAAKGAAEPHLGLSQLLRREGKPHRAIEELEEAIKLDPDNAFSHFKLAETLRDLGERNRAIASIQRAIALSPADSFYHYWLGDALLERRKFDAAIEALHAAVELSPGDDFLLYRTTAAFWGAGRHQEAIKAIRLAGELDPDNHLYHGVLAVLLAETGMSEEAALEEACANKMDELDRENLRRFCNEVGLLA